MGSGFRWVLFGFWVVLQVFGFFFMTGRHPEDEERTTELDLETTPRGRREDTRGGSREAQQGLAGGSVGFFNPVWLVPFCALFALSFS